MSSLPLIQWDHSLFDELQYLLARVATQPTTSLVRRLHSRLDEARPWFLAVCTLPGPNEADKQATENKTLTFPSGLSVDVSGEILTTANSVSSLLGISQLLAAVVSLQAGEARPRYPNRSVAEISTYLSCEWAEKLLDFLRELLRLTIGPDALTDPPFDSLRSWIEDLLVDKIAVGGAKERTIVDHSMLQLDESQKMIEELVRQARTGQTDFELAVYRVGALRAQQGKMVGILGAIAQGGYLGRGQLVQIVKWLKKSNRPDVLVGAVLAVFFVATRPMDTLDTADVRLETQEEWCKDLKFLKVVSSLIFLDDWMTPRLREAAKVSWSLFMLSALRMDASVSAVEIDIPAAEQYLSEAVSGEAFQYLREVLFQIRQDRGLESPEETGGLVEDELQRSATRSLAENDGLVVEQWREMVDTVAGKKNFVRNLRNREEDISIRRNAAHNPPPPANYQAFLALLALVYRSLPPDSAESLWDNTIYMGAILDSRGNAPTPAFWDMLVAISTGPSCAIKAYEKLKETAYGWANLFKFYQHYYEIMPHLFEPIKATRQPSLDPMDIGDVQFGKGWTRLLATVVSSSNVARSALLQAKPHPLQTLFDFLNCDIPLDLKSVIMDAITAFCARKGDAVDDDVINKAVEYYERISFVDSGLDTRHLDSNRIPAPIGWIAKMEYIEQDMYVYPLTKSYVHFLATLLPDPASVADAPGPSRQRVTSALRRGTFYVLDRVLLTAPARRYINEQERWDLLEAVLAFLSKALITFNMTELLTQATTRFIGPVATTLAEEAGFVILLRTLSEPTIIALLASILDSASVLPQPRAPHISSLLRHTLRVYHRILTIQLVFSDVLLRTLADPARNTSHPFRLPLNLQSLDHLLLSHLTNINNVALLVGDDDAELSYLAVKIIAALADSPVFSRSDVFRGEYTTTVNRLAGIIDASDDSIRIAQGFTTKLDGDGDDMTMKDVAIIEKRVLRGEGSKADLASLPLIVRLSILDLLLDGTAPDAPGPNIAHFLLGFSFRGHDLKIQDPRSPDSRLSCFSILLQHLNDSGFCYTYPVIAAKTAQLVYQLFALPATGRQAISFASTYTGQSAQQLLTLPRQCPALSPATSQAEGLGVARTADSEVPTTAEMLIAYLDYQRWIIAAASLEVFASQGRGATAADIAHALFVGSATEDDEDDEAKFGQRPSLIIDSLSSLDIQWIPVDGEQSAPRNLEFYSSFTFDEYKRGDSDSWNLEALGRGLKAYRRQLEKAGTITAATAVATVEAEAAYILKRLTMKNLETDIAIAKGSFAMAWNEVLKVGLTMLFRHISEDRQDAVLLELLDTILLRARTDLAPGVLEILCESALATVTVLVNLLGGLESVNLPTERLTAVLQGLVDAVTRSGTTETARGNLYASVGQFLQLITSFSPIPDDALTVAASTVGKDSAILSGSLGLHRATLAVLGAKKDRFINTLCRDAMDSREVWKTECFALLGAIASICQSDRDRQILSPLTQGGLLILFVRSLKDRELQLQDCLTADPENLHAYWVYEAKMAFLVAIAATRKGAEDLLNAGIFEILSTCGFITIQPITEETKGDSTAFEATTRQQKVLVCALQVLARTLSSLHRSARSGAGHGISFLNAHRETVLALLRENQQTISSVGLEELRLTISILAMSVHKVPTDDLRSPSGFGAFHLAVLSVAARCLDREAWSDAVLAPEDAIALEPHVLALNQVIVTYLCATTQGLRNGSGIPVFLNGISRANGNITKHIAAAPSLQTVVHFLGDLADDLHDLSGDYDAVVETGQDGTELSAEDLNKLQRAGLTVDGAWTPDMATAAFANRAALLHNVIESTLLLVWRHLLFYANDARGSQESVRPDNLSLSLGSFATSQMEGSKIGVSAVRALERVAAALRGTLDRLDELDAHPDLRRTGRETGEAYHGMLVRRLKELTAGLSGAGTDDA